MDTTALDLVRSLCATFADQYSADLTDPASVADQCHVVSSAFTTWWSTHGGQAEVVTGARFERIPQLNVEAVVVAHQATVVTLPDGTTLVVDFTARQFDPHAPVPVVVPLPVWREQWQPLSR